MNEDIYKIEKPKNSFPTTLDEFQELNSLRNDDKIKDILNKVEAEYLSWEQFKNKALSHFKNDKIWQLIKMQRQFSGEKTPVTDENGNVFSYNPRIHVEFLHNIDMELGGNFMGIDNFSVGDEQRFIKRNLIEESIASSQLEGANTSREIAKKMLYGGRKPKNYSEKMIVNNHEAMKWIEEDLKHKPLSVDLLKELHSKITSETIAEKYSGVFRETLDENGKPLVIKPWDHNIIAYIAPPKEFVEREMIKLIAFANDSDGSDFIHPLLKAIMLHFWMGLLHPFEDGNGRLARIIFYWYVLRKGYWAFSYISLSKFILKSPMQYSKAYIYSEQDDNDLNYFIHYNIEKLKMARLDFQEYVRRKISENRNLIEVIGKDNNLSIRQLRLLKDFSINNQQFITLVEYYNSYNIGKASGATDLQKLVSEGYLRKVRNGRNIFYYPTEKIKEVFR